MYLSCFFNGPLYYSRERLEKWKGAEENKYKVFEKEIEMNMSGGEGQEETHIKILNFKTFQLNFYVY